MLYHNKGDLISHKKPPVLSTFAPLFQTLIFQSFFAIFNPKKEESKSQDETVLKEAFRILDADKDSYLSVAEMKAAFAECSTKPSVSWA